MMGTAQTTEEELRKRIRAAIAYSGLTSAQVGSRLDPPIGASTVDRLKALDPHLGRATRVAALQQLPALCGVPKWFFEHGFLPPSGSDSDPRNDGDGFRESVDELAALRATVDELQRWRSEREDSEQRSA